MKTLKIGRSSTNDIIISDVTVSSQHAIITILDTKEVRIKDLNSMNGTHVNGKRIAAETTITASDVIKVGNAALDWVKYLNEKKKPKPPVFSGDASAIKYRKVIGRETGDIVLNHSDVSSNHAQLIEKVNGEIMIADSGSANGTYVNGQRISVQTLRAGDRVLIANKYPLDWENVFGKRPTPKTKNLKTVLIAAAAIAAVVIGFSLFPKGDNTLTAEKIYAVNKKAVVMIYGQYYYHVTAGRHDFGNFIISNGELLKDKAASYTGTGFFVSQDGKIVTNKHVAQPWEYDEQQIRQIKTAVQEYLKALARQSRRHQIEFLPLVNEVEVTGQLRSLGIVINDTHLNDASDIIPCTFLKTTNNNEIDVAVIQTNSKSLPVGVEHIVDLSKAVIDDADITVGEPLYTIGFPAGINVAQTSQGIEANNQDGKVSQMRGDYAFGHNIKIAGGASGSPVFDAHGQLIGVINAGFGSGAEGYNMAIKAKYAVELAK